MIVVLKMSHDFVPLYLQMLFSVMTVSYFGKYFFKQMNRMRDKKRMSISLTSLKLLNLTKTLHRLLL